MMYTPAVPSCVTSLVKVKAPTGGGPGVSPCSGTTACIKILEVVPPLYSKHSPLLGRAASGKFQAIDLPFAVQVEDFDSRLTWRMQPPPLIGFWISIIASAPFVVRLANSAWPDIENKKLVG